MISRELLPGQLRHRVLARQMFPSDKYIMIHRISSLALFVLWGLLMLQAGCGSCVKPDEQVILFPSDGHISKDGRTWTVPVHGWIFEPEHDSLWRQAFIDNLDDWLGTGPADHDNPYFRSRVRMFLVDNERGKKLRLHVAGRPFTMGASRENGHFRGTVYIPNADVAAGKPRRTVKLTTTPCRKRGRVDSGFARLLPPEGLSVISDIDDTVKVTEVLDKAALLANTFLEPFRAVPGMADRYDAWAAQGAAFHYVSASPWQLYPALASFMEAAGLPGGSFHLKSFHLFDRTFLNLFRSSESYKVPIIEKILRTFPDRRFVLVGDSGEQDPEVYGIVARQLPQQILHIYIRNVSPADEDPQRYAVAFRKIPVERWTVFDSAEELPERLAENCNGGKVTRGGRTGGVP